MYFTKKIEKECFFELILFGSGITLVSIFYRNNPLLTILLLLAWMIGIIFWHKKHDICFFIIGAILGPIAEIFAIKFGAWQYTNPTFLGIPIWLPLVWGIGVVFIKRISETFVKIEMK